MKFFGTVPTIIALGLILTPAMAHADYSAGKIGLTRTSGYYSGGGGEFTMYDRSEGFLDTSAYASSTSNVDGRTSFQTFCMELSEFTANPVDTWVSTTNINEATGDVTGPGSHAVKGGNTYGDNLDSRTAYLYTQFATGGLSSYDYTLPGRAGFAGELQEAIWYLEGEIGSVSGQAASWVNEAQLEINEGRWSGIGNVRVLNNYSGDARKQDQLYLGPVSVPVPAAFVLGLPLLGLIGVFRFARHRNC